jgi:hypothetical protein
VRPEDKLVAGRRKKGEKKKRGGGGGVLRKREREEVGKKGEGERRRECGLAVRPHPQKVVSHVAHVPCYQ